MNEIMRNMMKPIIIPAKDNSKAILRQKQEEHVLEFLKTVPNSMTSSDVRSKCYNIPKPRDGFYMSTRAVSNIMKRLEGKGLVISTLYQGLRYYSIPV